ncbi:MAG: response regulator [Desulfobacteraceae bacterium]|nr:MAG: response regulator [Desulfobacteraceae bacterium]
MEGKDLLEGKKILVVDDEPDILETLEDLLSMAEVSKAQSFESAKTLLDSAKFDLAILDIMGVNGYELLAICNRKNIAAVMLTSHALTPENIMQSFKMGAASFIPKDKISQIPVFLNDVLEAKAQGKHVWSQWNARLGEAYWEKKFGPKWKEKEKKFWSDFNRVLK